MLILKGYKFRLYPNAKQQELINKTIGCTRQVYNHFLYEKQNDYKKTKTSKSAYEQMKELKELQIEYPYLKEVDSCSLRNSIFALDDAYKRFYSGSGYPKYKNKNTHNSYKTNNIKNDYKGKHYESIKLDLKNKVITLPKLKEVKIRGYRNINNIIGDIKSAVIRREAGKYYVSVLVEEEIILQPFIPKNIIGIDLGIKDLIVTSTGEKIENSIKTKNLKKRIKGLQRGLSRCKPGSKNRYKLKIKLQRCYQKLKNMRKYLIHNITNKLIEENDIIITEDLNIGNMQKNHNIAKALVDTSLYEIIRTLKYKAKWKNKKLIQIDRYYPSSQICSRCNYQNRKVKDLSIRKWECPKCMTTHDRDINASLNILWEGIKIYMKEELQA